METESKRHGTDRPAAKIEGHCNCGKTSVVVAEPAFLGASSALCRESSAVHREEGDMLILPSQTVATAALRVDRSCKL